MTNDFKMTNVRNLLILDTLHFNPWAGGPPRTCVIDGARAAGQRRGGQDLGSTLHYRLTQTLRNPPQG